MKTNRKQLEIDFTDYKPNAVRVSAKRRKSVAPVPILQVASARIDYSELFGTLRWIERTTGEDVLIIREWMARKGLPEIPEDWPPASFASAIQWKTKPRHAWVHFYASDTAHARQYLKVCADHILSMRK
jgi:hypothetical protein